MIEDMDCFWFIWDFILFSYDFYIDLFAMSRLVNSGQLDFSMW